MHANPAEPIWRPSPDRIDQANMTAFLRAVAAEWRVDVSDYPSLYRFSIETPEKFWLSVWSFCGVIAQTRGDVGVRDFHKMPGATFFPEARLNFAENLLRRRDEGTAIVFWGEQRVRRTLTFTELYREVSRLAYALLDVGVKSGDRIAAYLPNMPEAVIGVLAASSIGAVWSSCSPDFGVTGVLDRFGQIQPKVLLAADGYFYGGRTHDSLEKIRAIAGQLSSLEYVVIASYVGEKPDLSDVPRATTWNAFTDRPGAKEVEFEQLPFNHPLYVLYSSGTTGVPKCIVHGAGGTLIQHLKEHQLHCDVHIGDRVMYFTTCGWMMWNWLVSALASGATLLLYDGSPFYPDGRVLFDFADATGMTLFGTSAKYIDSVNKAGLQPVKTHRLATVRTMTSTGSPLAAESFDFVYTNIKPDIHLASISGGTDIVACFVGGNPIGPVWRGEIQARALGMKVEVFDEEGRSLPRGKGELVCTAPFPSLPLGFWNDPGDTRYLATYFARFPGAWWHGDFVELTEHDGVIVHGRSDAVINPGGVRIGTAEIYRQIEQIDEVLESLAIGQKWQNDERIVLFVRLRDGTALDGALIKRIKDQIRQHASPRHVPAKIVQISDIPRTRSGKIAELAVREIVHGREVKNREALANPESLDLYRNLPALSR